MHAIDVTGSTVTHVCNRCDPWMADETTHRLNIIYYILGNYTIF